MFHVSLMLTWNKTHENVDSRDIIGHIVTHIKNGRGLI